MLADSSPIFTVAVALLPLAHGLGVAPAPQLAALRHAPLPLLQAGQAVLRRAPAPLLQAGETEVDEPPLDPRGFVVPQIGDVVKVPSKWQGEYDLAQVDFVQFIESRQAYDVDVRKLKAIGGGLYTLPGGLSRPPAERVDVAKLGRIDAEFVSDRDAYLVDESELRFTAPKTDVDALAEGLAEYKELKARLLIEAAIVGAAISAALLPTLGSEIAATFFAGVGAGVAYLLLLESESDALGADEPPPKAIALAASARLAVPLVLVSLLAAGNLVGGRATSALSTVPKEQFFAGVAGFLSYKLPLLARQFARAIQELSQEGAQAPVEKGGLSTGSLGMMVRLAKESKEAKARAAEAAEGEEAKAAANAPRQVVLCGPSGVGKSTLIAKLVEAAPAALSFSVSSTTRPPRAGEADGVDYNFVSAAAFDEMVAAGEFIEWAQVGDHKYGTSVGAIEQVTADGRVCLLDVDVQGVKALRTQPALRPFYVWVAPPSLDALRQRLTGRGTEAPDEVERRLARAVSEVEFALTDRGFDLTLINGDLDTAFDELRGALEKAGVAVGAE